MVYISVLLKWIWNGLDPNKSQGVNHCLTMQGVLQYLTGLPSVLIMLPF
jgi:hypothetical protein